MVEIRGWVKKLWWKEVGEEGGGGKGCGEEEGCGGDSENLANIWASQRGVWPHLSLGSDSTWHTSSRNLGQSNR